LPEAYLDTPVDFDSLRAAGAVMGSGGMIVADETTCMVEFSKYFMQFVVDESCGKCPPCRLGSLRMLEILERITAGQGQMSDLDELKWTARGMEKGSLCGLGQLAPSPVLSTLRHFEDEFIAHIERRECPARKCKALITFEVVADLCTGCMVCARSCGSHAITGIKREPHVIDPEACERCGLCAEVCNFDAIVIKSPRSTSS
jgi:ferredoxin